MNKKLIYFAFSILIFCFISSCSTDDAQTSGNVNRFIWAGLNKYYLYQENVSDLQDSNFKFGFFNDSKPEDFFEHLIYDRQSTDRFSVIFSDYNRLEQVLSGTSSTTGAKFGFSYKSGSTTEVFGWVKYVLPSTDAATKGVTRGMVFSGINGTPLTVSNYQNLSSQTTITLNLADYNSGNITPNGNSITITKAAYSENPVYIKKVFTQGSKKIGYLMYNGFLSNYENQLNDAFGYFKSEGVTHLILDLRYNSGGSVITAARLASMITGQFAGQLFATQQWNKKVMASGQNFNNYFPTAIANGTPINSLNLNKVYILTTKSTASASELVINCLKPFINVVQIGKTTVGKNVGSITLYDSPDFSKNNVSTKHTYAMQPIVLKIVNKNGFGDYAAGISPDASNDIAENIGNLDILGEVTEPYLAKTLEFINLGGRISRPDFKTFEEIIDKSKRDLTSEMYIN
ncbi:MAG: S41 family peptidase [Limnohabitans sp.]|nr:S41 family peptidase [Limnohabitans sp.]